MIRVSLMGILVVSLYMGLPFPTANNSTNNNIVFFFVSDVKIVKSK